MVIAKTPPNKKVRTIPADYSVKWSGSFHRSLESGGCKVGWGEQCQSWLSESWILSPGWKSCGMGVEKSQRLRSSAIILSAPGIWLTSNSIPAVEARHVRILTKRHSGWVVVNNLLLTLSAPVLSLKDFKHMGMRNRPLTTPRQFGLEFQMMQCFVAYWGPNELTKCQNQHVKIFRKPKLNSWMMADETSDLTMRASCTCICCRNAVPIWLCSHRSGWRNTHQPMVK